VFINWGREGKRGEGRRKEREEIQASSVILFLKIVPPLKYN